jgi:MoxR-like ATPase
VGEEIVTGSEETGQPLPDELRARQERELNVAFALASMEDALAREAVEVATFLRATGIELDPLTFVVMRVFEVCVTELIDPSLALEELAESGSLARPISRRICSGATPRSGGGQAPGYAAGVAHGSIDELEAALREADYLPDRGLATALYLALALEKPVLLEGDAGVGKTEAAKALATALDARLIRLQCYEGLDVAHAVYEWNYPRQLLHIRAAQEGTVTESELFGPEYLIRRPLLEAIDSDDPVVLLIDEIDRADEEFEAFLLEVLSDFQITIPELGTIRARRRPAVILTSNRTRELHDALKRRALYHWIGHPSIEREIAIVRLRVPGIPERLAVEAAAFVRGLRGLDLAKPPGVAETIDWALALDALGRRELDAEVVQQTLGSVLKYHEDIETVRDATLARLVDEARAASAAS